MAFLAQLQKDFSEGTISQKIFQTFTELYESYARSLAETGLDIAPHEEKFATFLKLVKQQLAAPFSFEPFHKRVTAPFDYTHFGIEFIRPIVNEQKSTLMRKANIDKIEKQLAAGENVILFANHQTEVDPQLMSIVLEKTHKPLADETIFVAGDRVVSDPMAVPFSMGRNLLCIYSKKYIDTPPEKKLEKQLHNQRTMRLMSQLLTEGGKCIYVAPSGGRDRPGASGKVEAAPFDPQSIEMFRLMAAHAKKPTHFYPLALATYDILPPPSRVQTELGERRRAKRVGIHFAFGDEIDMENFPCEDRSDRHFRRRDLAYHIWKLVNDDYETLLRNNT